MDYVEAAIGLEGGGDEAVDGLSIRDIGLYEGGLSTGAANEPYGFGSTNRVDVVDDELGAASGEEEGGGAADAGGGAGDEGDFVTDVHARKEEHPSSEGCSAGASANRD